MAEHNFSKGIEMQNVFLRLKNKLEEAGILAASFELRQIFGAVTKKGVYYDIRLENEFTEEEIIAIEDMVDRRITGEPLQYILGEWEFFGLPMLVGEGVLIPRPETELLCEQGFEFLEARTRGKRRVLDLCCGTGCIGIATAKYIADADVICVDKFDKPLEYTEKNAALNGVNLALRRVDVLEPPPSDIGMFDLIMTNPPYIKSGDMTSLSVEVKHEPETALDGGEDGLDFYRAILKNWSGLLAPDGALMAEIGIHESEAVTALFKEAGFLDVTVINDYCDIPRIVIGYR